MSAVEPGSGGQRRKVGPADQGREIAIRYGGQLKVIPASRPGGWRVDTYPDGILRLTGGSGLADSHTFAAIAVGAGQLTLAADGDRVDAYTVRVRVVRDTLQRPAP